MISSSKHKAMLKFIRASQITYVSSSPFKLVKSSQRFHILCNNKLVKWEPLGGFSCIEAAERFINARNYEDATADKIGLSSDDFAYVIEAYNFDVVDENKWTAQIDDSVLILTYDGTELILDVEKDGSTTVSTFDNVSDLILALDAFFENEDIYSSEAIQIKTAVTAAINVRDLAKNLVRVKSSNVWAYGMNLRSRKDTTGEVVVQFKGDRGGPGDVYIYYDVPLVVWRKWLSATSKGHYFWMYIRNTYKYSKLTGDKRGKLPNAINR